MEFQHEVRNFPKDMNKILTFLCIAASALPAAARTSVFDIDLRKQLAPVPDTMYGIFFEDINFAADGGLYAELVKNRSFEFPAALQGWKTFGRVEIMEDGPFGRCPHYVRLTDPGHAHKHTGIENEGFFGIAVTHCNAVKPILSSANKVELAVAHHDGLLRL